MYIQSCMTDCLPRNSVGQCLVSPPDPSCMSGLGMRLSNRLYVYIHKRQCL